MADCLNLVLPLKLAVLIVRMILGIGLSKTELGARTVRRTSDSFRISWKRWVAHELDVEVSDGSVARLYS